VLKTFQDSHTLLIALIIILTNSFFFFLQRGLKGGPKSKMERKWHSFYIEDEKEMIAKVVVQI
jgi:hypothetical protein